MNDDDSPTPRETPLSKQFASVDCPLCFHQDLWKGSPTCPGCGRTPEVILNDGTVGKISQFKLPGLYANHPELTRLPTDPELRLDLDPDSKPPSGEKS